MQINPDSLPSSDDIDWNDIDWDNGYWEEPSDHPSEYESLPRAVPVFFLINAGNSMTGPIIRAVNDAMKTTVDYLKIIKEEKHIYFYIFVMKISDQPEWDESSLVPVENYQWKDIKPCGKADLNRAFKELNTRLSGLDHFGFPYFVLMPEIVFISTDSPDDRSSVSPDDGIKTLEKNLWFRSSERTTFVLGKPIDEDLTDNLIDIWFDSNNRYMLNEPDRLKEQMISIFSRYRELP